MDENVDYDERESEFDIEDEDRSVQLNEEEKLGDDIEVRNIYILDSIRQEQKIKGVTMGKQQCIKFIGTSILRLASVCNHLWYYRCLRKF